MATVEGDVPRIGGLQVRGHLLAVEPLERIPHQRIAMTSPLLCRVHADKRQVPVRLIRMVLCHLLEDRWSSLTGCRRGRSVHQLTQSLVIGMNAGSEPECRSGVFVRAEGAIVREGCTAECADEVRHDRVVVVRPRPDPTRHRVARKCERDGVDSMNFVVRRHGSDVHGLLLLGSGSAHAVRYVTRPRSSSICSRSNPARRTRSCARR